MNLVQLQGLSVRGVHTEFIWQFPTQIVYSVFLRGLEEAAKGVKNTLDPPACGAL